MNCRTVFLFTVNYILKKNFKNYMVWRLMNIFSIRSLNLVQ